MKLRWAIEANVDLGMTALLESDSQRERLTAVKIDSVKSAWVTGCNDAPWLIVDQRHELIERMRDELKSDYEELKAVMTELGLVLQMMTQWLYIYIKLCYLFLNLLAR